MREKQSLVVLRHTLSACLSCQDGSRTVSAAQCACRYETIIATLCDSLGSLDEPEARAAMPAMHDVSRAVSAAQCACRYETIIATLCDSLDSLDEPEARAAMVWIIGEYAERIDNADELLESFLEVWLTRSGDPLSLRSLREETEVLQLLSTIRIDCREHPCLRHLSSHQMSTSVQKQQKKCLIASVVGHEGEEESGAGVPRGECGSAIAAGDGCV